MQKKKIFCMLMKTAVIQLLLAAKVDNTLFVHDVTNHHPGWQLLRGK
jgi:hypothetical protein